MMGHADSSMAATHRYGIEESRLKAVVNHVRAWLYPPSPEENKKSENISKKNTQGPIFLVFITAYNKGVRQENAGLVC